MKPPEIPMADDDPSENPDHGQAPAEKKTPSNKSTKKGTGRHAKKKPAYSPPSPEALSSLAVQILALDKRGISGGTTPGLPVSEPRLDHRFLHALKRAELLLKTASGDTDEDIHAYQVFREGEELQTFDEIAGRFAEVGWSTLTSRNSVEKCIEELVWHADQEIANEIDFWEQQVALEIGGPVSHPNLRTRLERTVDRIFSRMSLKHVLKDPKGLADQTAQFLIGLISQQISCIGPASRQETHESLAGYSSFDGFVLEPPQFQGFLRERSVPHLTPDLLQAAAFHLRTAATRKNMRLVPDEIADLRRTLLSSSVIPAVVIGDMALLADMAGKKDDAGQKKLAAKIAVQLDAALVPWLKREELSQQVAGLRRRANRTHPATGSEAEQQTMLNQALDDLATRVSAVGADSSSEAGDRIDLIGSAIDKAIQICRDHREDLTDPLQALRDTLKHPAQAPKRSPRRLRRVIGEFFRTASPPRTERRVRPYEIFLFAAQAKLLPDKLVRSRRLLESGFIPNPPHWSTLSILAHHQGHPFNHFDDEVMSP